MAKKNETAESAGKTTKKSAKKTPAKKAAKKSAAAKNTPNTQKDKKSRAGRAERLSSEQVAAKREETKKLLAGTAGMGPKDLQGALKVNANQLRRVLADNAFEKVGTSGRNVKYKLAG